MKIFDKLLSVIALISSIITLGDILFRTIMKLKFDLDVKNSGSIGIIGSADGPTSVIVGSKHAEKFNKIVKISPFILLFSNILLMIRKKSSKD